MPKKRGRPPKRQAPEAEVPESAEAAEAPEIAGRFLNVLSADLLEDVGRCWIDIFLIQGAWSGKLIEPDDPTLNENEDRTCPSNFCHWPACWRLIVT